MRGLAIIGLVALLALAGCGEGAEDGEAPPLPDPLAQATQDCTRSGGQMMASGIANARVCIHDTRDSGKVCRRGSECEGDCLARSGTCSPVRPLFGCNEILMDSGARATLCRD